MIAKNTIQKLEDSQLIRIFLDFVQTYHLQYEKINKQISYKCHQATWVLAKSKATGYGRTQAEAYKHALRNLLQILVQDEYYTDFFSKVCHESHSGERQLNKKSSQKKNYVVQNKKQQKIQNPLNPYGRQQQNLDYTNINKNAYKLRQHKTEAFDNDYYHHNQLKTSLTGSIGCSKSNIPPAYPGRSSLKQKDKENKLKYETLTTNKNQLNSNHSNSASKLGLCSKKNYTQQCQYMSYNKRQVYHSKINLNIQSSSSIASAQPVHKYKQSSATQVSEQLKEARLKMRRLEQQLESITVQNNALRSRLEAQNSQKMNKSTTKMAYTQNCEQPDQVANLDIQDLQNCCPLPLQKKIFVPRLKLEVLPSYHKQSEKSLNDSLLALYNEKHNKQIALI